MRLRLRLLLLAVAVVVFLALVLGLPKLLLMLVAAPLVVADKLVGALGADSQTAEPGRPRRGGLGGSTTTPKKGTETKRTRPRRGGL